MNITFNQRHYSLDQLDKLITDYPESQPIQSFINDWNKGIQIFEFNTSGSTGRPKKIKIQRRQIEASVVATRNFLNLQSGEVAMICLDPKFIASLMMVARALVLKLDLQLEKPNSNPLLHCQNTDIDFISLVPIQISQMIKDNNLSDLKNIKNILIGGAPLSRSVFNELSKIDTNIYHTYGMTETVSHIALMSIKGAYEEGKFELLPNISIGLDQEQCLKINGAITNHKELITNDIVELLDDNKAFRWVGRRDLVINSGGIKIHPEKLEKEIQIYLDHKNRFFNCFISSIPDPNLGSKCIMITEGETIDPSLFSKIQNHLRQQFSKHHFPKEAFSIKAFKKTSSGKLKRKETTDLIHLG